jgi:tripartite-type tricarboxylate transporter receptor subunit TctC
MNLAPSPTWLTIVPATDTLNRMQWTGARQPMKRKCAMCATVLLNVGGAAVAQTVAYPARPVSNLKAFIDLARRKLGELLIASPGYASSPHIAAELLASVAGFSFTHVPYKGTPPALTDLRAPAMLPDVRKRIAELGLDPTALSQEAFAAFLYNEFDKWGAIIRARNIRLQQ